MPLPITQPVACFPLAISDLPNLSNREPEMFSNAQNFRTKGGTFVAAQNAYLSPPSSLDRRSGFLSISLLLFWLLTLTILVDAKEIIDWLTKINFRNTQSDTFKKHTPGTGRWLLDNAKFQQWINVESEKREFWVTGMRGSLIFLWKLTVELIHRRHTAGAGKSVLA